MTLFVGTSGWQYKDWRGLLYPDGTPARLWLEEYAAHFATVESNNAFYRLPSYETFDAWRERTPPDFVVAVKASRFLTHVKRLKEPEEPVHRLMSHAAGLGDRLGPVLLQLPPTLRRSRPPRRLSRPLPGRDPGRGRAAPRLLVGARRAGRTGGPERRAVLGRCPVPPGDPAVADRRLGVRPLPHGARPAVAALRAAGPGELGAADRGDLARRP
ncbi:hypothetical protein GCM10010365_27150 [Streptomyces poonensis]|uniref:DUF72 domain-containing protein n=1 Tax=Streptomyces poonensis TaxID=68255 RepID=A0A918PFU2_9ACTN|nr:hypothetical protein GCM10010365_27150 [Streptomyces poonensis]GLJ88657.1 hypothetical protein GCM10017589_12570 [Streptomyces poonensis]